MLDYRNILRTASNPHKSMRTMKLELLFPEKYQKTVLYTVLAFARKTTGSSTETVNWGADRKTKQPRLAK